LSGEFLGDFWCTIVDGDTIAMRGDIAGEVGSHDCESDHSDMVL
jgi:hypothetical protein